MARRVLKFTYESFVALLDGAARSAGLPPASGPVLGVKTDPVFGVVEVYIDDPNARAVLEGCVPFVEKVL